MSLNSIINNAASGLTASQLALKTVSDNVANVDTVGYTRKIVDQQAQVTNGQGSGVSVTQVQNAADRFLQAASLGAASDSGRSSIVSSLLDQAQTLFGDPSASGSFFSSLDGVFSAFSSLASNPTNAGRAQALSQVSSFFNQSSSLSTSLSQLSSQVDQRVQGDVGQINQLLKQIDGLNSDISRAVANGGDATGSQNQQSQLIDQLSKLMDVKVSALPSGGAIVRSSDGLALAGDGSGAAQFSYDSSGPTGQISITNGAGVTQPLGARLQSGELKGLLDLRNTDLPQVSGQLAELTSGVADQLNSIHNAYSAVPAPSTMTGRNTGLDLPSALSGFTGKTTIAEVNTTTGALSHRIDIDFGAGTMSVDGGAASSFTGSTFLATLNTALGGGSATYTNGALTLNAPGGQGLAIQDDATTPATNAGRGFSAYFGLNDLVSSTGFSNYNTGLSSTSASGYPAGQTLKLRLSDASGSTLQDVTVTTPAGTTMASLIGAMNASPNGVGAYGSFALDANGQLAFTPNAGSGVSLSVVTDQTQRTGGGPSISQLFGIGDAQRNARATSFSVRSALTTTPGNLSLAKLNLSATPGQPVLSAGDASGADALGQAGTAIHAFNAAGGLAASNTGLSDYASNIAASIARKAANADAAKTQAAAVASEATSRRSSYEGVNLDNELVNMTTYQQAYNASARMIQAAKEMYDTLISMVN